MLKKAIIFIHQIRKSERQIKRFWLFVFTLISMTLVLFIWLKTMTPLITEQNSAAEQQPANPSFLTIFNRGFKVAVKDILRTLKNKLWIGRVSIIKIPGPNSDNINE